MALPAGRKLRIAYLVTHPIHYQVPLLRRVAAQPDWELKVFFGSDFSVRNAIDPGFGQAITWDVPLLEGYEYEVLPPKGPQLARNEEPDFRRPYNEPLAPKLAAGKFDVLWVHGYHRLYHWETIYAAKRLGIKVILRDEVTAISAQRSGFKTLGKKLFFTGFNCFIDAWLAIGTLNRRYYHQQGIRDGKIFTVPYAVDNDFFQARIAQVAPEREILRAKLGLEPGRPIILFSGKLIPRKRPLDLLAAYGAIAKDPAARRPYLLYAGDGELRGAMEAQMAASGLEGARILGFQSQAQLAALYDLCDLFVLASEREAWGLVVNEAMNAGRAIVVNDRIGSGPDLVRPGENGFIYPFGDDNAFADALRQCLSDPERLAAMGRASRAIIDHWSYAEDIAGVRQAVEYCFRNAR